jgi:4-hydroxy-tetrahydrodipicolinate synthase
MLHGAFTALVTPFADGAVDEKAYRALIDFQIGAGINGLVPCGTTGESATLSHDEHKRVMAVCIEQVAGRVPVVAGTGSNSTSEALSLTRHAREAGATAALVITPYYNRPTQEGLFRHYMAVAEGAGIPVIIYNVPSRTGTDILPETVARLAEHPMIIGIKEATGSLKRASDIIGKVPPEFVVLSGDDHTVLPLLAVGGRGVISVVSNLVPDLMSRMVAAYGAGKAAEAMAIHYRIFPLMDACFLETNPIPAKAALAMMGMIREELRLPLTPLTAPNREKMAAALATLGLA